MKYQNMYSRLLLLAISTSIIQPAFTQTRTDHFLRESKFMQVLDEAIENQDVLTIKALDKIKNKHQLNFSLHNENKLYKAKKLPTLLNYTFTKYIQTNPSRSYTDGIFSSIIKNINMNKVKNDKFIYHLGLSAEDIFKKNKNDIEIDDTKFKFEINSKIDNESYVLNNLLSRAYFLTEEELVKHYAYYIVALNGYEPHKKILHKELIYKEIRSHFCGDINGSEFKKYQSVDGKKDSVYENTCSIRYTPELYTKIYKESDKIDILISKLNNDIKQINIHLLQTFNWLKTSQQRSDNDKIEELSKSIYYQKYLESYLRTAKTLHGSLLLNKRAQLNNGHGLKSPKEIYELSQSPSIQNKQHPEVDKNLAITYLLQAKKDVGEFKKEIDTWDASRLSSIEEINKGILIHNFETLNFMTQKYISTYPHIMGEVLSENIDLYLHPITKNLNNWAKRKQNLDTFHKTIRWGSAIAGTGLLLTGIGSGVGAYLVGASTTTGVTLAAVSSASFLAGSIVGVISLSGSIMDVRYQTSQVELMAKAIYGGNEYAVRDLSEAIEKLHEAQVFLAIEASLTLVDVVGYVKLPKLLSSKQPIEAVKIATSKIDEAITDMDKVLVNASMAPSLTTQKTELSIIEKIFKMMDEILPTLDEQFNIATASSEQVDMLKEALRQTKEELKIKNLASEFAKRDYEMSREIAENFWKISDQWTKYLGFEIQFKDGILRILDHPSSALSLTNSSTSDEIIRKSLTTYREKIVDDIFKVYNPKDKKNREIFARFLKKSKEQIILDFSELEKQAIINVNLQKQGSHFKDAVERPDAVYIIEYNQLIAEYINETVDIRNRFTKMVDLIEEVKDLEWALENTIKDIAQIDPYIISNYRP